METTRAFTSDVAFTDTVKAIQTRKGSRAAYARMERSGGWQASITAELRAFIETQTSVFLATANASGQPYVQHRGGPPGFLRVLDDRTVGFVDYSGNRQFITQGNLQENDRAHLFLIDYERRLRFKLWGTARVLEDATDLMSRLMPKDGAARPEQVVLFHVDAWDANCPQHIPMRVAAQASNAAIDLRDRRIAELEAEVQALRGTSASATRDAR